ncbi:hypothetical protein T265_00549 [Opisthorchis viverrini]|uniref:Uncharacterized protein n=1 Tax=Opisthorchis viverrini TaxID=6198 RepID=A0A075AJM9_OPIVI|nr:hypothetical protein T265_00549 [Opisthorchis viverrini]KER33664.1 hypothetical protein T265_00549 [Opisthorchis viverrini]
MVIAATVANNQYTWILADPQDQRVKPEPRLAVPETECSSRVAQDLSHLRGAVFKSGMQLSPQLDLSSGQDFGTITKFSPHSPFFIQYP